LSEPLIVRIRPLAAEEIVVKRLIDVFRQAYDQRGHKDLLFSDCLPERFRFLRYSGEEITFFVEPKLALPLQRVFARSYDVSILVLLLAIDNLKAFDLQLMSLE